jgi:hypothetical protein
MGGTTTAKCTDAFPTTGRFSQSAAYTTLVKEDIVYGMMPVTITAGPSTTATGSTATQTGKSDATASQSSDASTESSSTSTGGLPRITASPGMIMGGAAAALMAVAW